MSYEIESTEVVLLDKANAENWLSMNNFPNQRSIKLRKIQEMVFSMNCGEFRKGVDIDFVSLEGKTYLINGQHTLTAFLESKLELLEVNRVSFKASSMDDALKIYSGMDVGTNRSSRDIVRAYGLAEKLSIPDSWLGALRVAYPVVMADFVGHYYSVRRPTKTEDVKLIEEWVAYFRPFLEATRDADTIYKRSMWRAQNISVAIATFRWSVPYYEPAVAKRKAEDENFPYARSYDMIFDFWYGSAMDDGLAAADPRKHHRNHIIFTKLGGGGGSALNVKVVQRLYSVVFIARCFNRWIEMNLDPEYRLPDRPPTVKSGGRNSKFEILGTPWSGNWENMSRPLYVPSTRVGGNENDEEAE